MRNLVSFSTQCTSLCVRRLVGLYACDFQLVSSTLLAVGTALFTRCGSALLSSFHPLLVRSSHLLLALLFSFAVSIMYRVVLDLDHASRRSGLQILSSGFLSRDHPLIPSRSCSRVCWLHASTRRQRCCSFSCVCLSVCFSRPARRHHGVSMNCLIANCSLVYSMLTHLLRVGCWTDQLFLPPRAARGGH